MLSKAKISLFSKQVLNKSYHRSWLAPSLMPTFSQHGYRMTSLQRNSSRSSKNSFYTMTGLFFSLLSAGYAASYLNSQIQCEAEANDTFEPTDAPTRLGLTKLDVKKYYSRAGELYENGQNEEALRYYRMIYKVYTRSSKASEKKIILMAQKIGILVALQGKYEYAFNWFVRSYDDVTKLKDDKLPFEMYYDICIMQYKMGMFSESIDMFKECLEHTKVQHADNHEQLALIHQQLGFSYFKKGMKEQSEKHLTDALEQLNAIKKTNKAILFYACQEFIEFYWNLGDFKRTALFIEQAKLLVRNEDAFNNEYKPLIGDIQSAYLKKYLKELNPRAEQMKLEAMSVIIKEQLGPYYDQAQKRNQPFHKLSPKEKSGDTHNLLYW